MSLFIDEQERRFRGRRIAAAIVLVLLAGTMLFGSWYVVDAGERAVVYDALDGGVQDHSYGEGLHFKIPFVQKATTYDVRDNIYTAQAGAASRDLQDVNAEITIRYAPEAAWVPWIHQKYGESYAAKLIVPGVQESVKATTAQYNAEELITKRGEVKLQIREALRARLVENHVQVLEMDLTDFQFSETFSAAIEQKVVAEQQALEEKNRLERVRFQADQDVVRAQANAEVVRLEAEAEANKTRALNHELVQSPLYLQYLWLQTWNGQLPTYLGGDAPQLLLGLPAEE